MSNTPGEQLREVMAELRIPRAHSNDWYDHLATIQEGYFLPWQSEIAPRSGDDAFRELLFDSIKEDDVALEIACGHGELSLELAGKCARVTAYDRVQSYIDLAEKNKNESGITNVDFLCYDALSPEHVEMRLPVEDQSVDLIVCRLGPHHWLQDVKRVCKPGATLLQLSPMEEPIPAWSSKLPHVMHYENSGRHSGAGSIHQSVDNRLHQAGLVLHSGWGFDVPEVFSDQAELYRMITWGLPPEKTPTYEDVAEKIQLIFDTFAEPDGIVLRHCRYLWQAYVL